MRLAPALALASSLALAPGPAAPDEDARRDAHEAVRSALLERATLPTSPPDLPGAGNAMGPGAASEHARRMEAEQRAAHERAVRRGEQHRTRHVDGDHAGDGPRRAGMHDGDASGECRDAAGAMRTREMHGEMDGGHTGGSGDGPHMGGR